MVKRRQDKKTIDKAVAAVPDRMAADLALAARKHVEHAGHEPFPIDINIPDPIRHAGVEILQQSHPNARLRGEGMDAEIHFS